MGVRDDAANDWGLTITAQGNASPGLPVWGDYFSMGLNGQDLNEWVTAAFTLDGGTANGDVVPRYVRFRRGN